MPKKRSKPKRVILPISLPADIYDRLTVMKGRTGEARSSAGRRFILEGLSAADRAEKRSV